MLEAILNGTERKRQRHFGVKSMNKGKMAYDEYFSQVVEILGSTGLLLAAGEPSKPTNAMTIGWGNLGVVWGRKIWVVLVRPSRFTYKLIEEAGDFTVNVPSKDLAGAVAYCGSHSGRDEDKLAKLGLSVAEGQKVSSGVVNECPINYECRVMGKSDIVPGMLDGAVKDEYYGDGDYHRVYFGEIVACYADRKAAAGL
jgi:flavin reductase (DIM6/NTAB) family NADH-FMN oxidoreductase RutF